MVASSHPSGVLAGLPEGRHISAGLRNPCTIYSAQAWQPQAMERYLHASEDSQIPVGSFINLHEICRSAHKAPGIT